MYSFHNKVGINFHLQFKKKKPYWTPTFCFGHGGEMSELIFKGTFYNRRCSRAEGSPTSGIHLPLSAFSLIVRFPRYRVSSGAFFSREKKFDEKYMRMVCFFISFVYILTLFFFHFHRGMKKVKFFTNGDVVKCDSVNGIFSSYVLTLTYMIIDVEFL